MLPISGYKGTGRGQHRNTSGKNYQCGLAGGTIKKPVGRAGNSTGDIGERKSQV
jgi:hypothetical protein